MYLVFKIFISPLILKPISLSIFYVSFSCFSFDILLFSPKTQTLGFEASFSVSIMKRRGKRNFRVPPHLQTNPVFVHFTALGAVPSPVDCYLCNRGLKTLQIRMEKHFENGMAVAQFLESNPLVEKVVYPGMFI